MGTNLRREGDVLERLVLAPGAQHVGERAEGELVERRRRQRAPLAREPRQRRQQRAQPVAQHQQLRVQEPRRAAVRQHVALRRAQGYNVTSASATSNVSNKRIWFLMLLFIMVDRSSMDQYFCDTNYLMFENKWIITIINYLHARVSYNFLEDIA